MSIQRPTIRLSDIYWSLDVDSANAILAQTVPAAFILCGGYERFPALEVIVPRPAKDAGVR